MWVLLPSYSYMLIRSTDIRAVVITATLYWAVVECGVGILAACLPSLHFLLKGWSWESFVNTTKSIFGYNSSELQPCASDDRNIHVNHAYDVAYGQNNSNSSSLRLVVRKSGFNDGTSLFGTNTHVVHVNEAKDGQTL